MSLSNLFTSSYEGPLRVFFGRQNELAFARDALENRYSPYRAFFITGNRGCGKTTLLERISHMGADLGWLTIDVHSTHASQAILDALAGGTERTVAKSAAPSAAGLTLGSISSSTTITYNTTSLARLLQERAKSLQQNTGILITVDEVQKIPEEDAENICASAQLALRKGLNIMLVLAGLPGSKEKVASYPGCTFMQRAFDMQIGALEVDETIQAYEDAFRKMPQWQIEDDAIWEAGRFSQGYPYLMQLIGYYAVERASDMTQLTPAPITLDDIRDVEPIALDGFKENVLSPILSTLPESLSDYLKAMCLVGDEQGRIATSAVAKHLGKAQSQVSSYRKRLIDRRLIEPDGRGYVLFLLPHIREYYEGSDRALREWDPKQQWNRYS